MTNMSVNGVITSFNYDPFGRRIEKVSGSTTTIYAYDGDNVVEELNASGTTTARFVQGLGIDEPLAELRSGATSYYEADGLGSSTSLTSSAGAVAKTYVYDSFGNDYRTTGTLNNPYQFTAREFDSETGLYYYRARYYDPSVGRFLSEDPLNFRSDVNFYPYALNNPVDYSDPFGQEPREGCYDCRGKAIQGLPVAKGCCAGEPRMSSSAPNPYLPWEGYAGVNASLIYKYGGNGRWGQLVRSCLICMYRHGATPGDAHWFCYKNSAERTGLTSAGEGLARAVGAAAVIEAGQVVVAVNSKGTDITAVGPWIQLVGGRQ